MTPATSRPISESMARIRWRTGRSLSVIFVIVLASIPGMVKANAGPRATPTDWCSFMTSVLSEIPRFDQQPIAAIDRGPRSRYASESFLAADRCAGGDRVRERKVLLSGLPVPARG